MDSADFLWFRYFLSSSGRFKYSQELDRAVHFYGLAGYLIDANELPTERRLRDLFQWVDYFDSSDIDFSFFVHRKSMKFISIFKKLDEKSRPDFYEYYDYFYLHTNNYEEYLEWMVWQDKYEKKVKQCMALLDKEKQGLSVYSSLFCNEFVFVYRNHIFDTSINHLMRNSALPILTPRDCTRIVKSLTLTFASAVQLDKSEIIEDEKILEGRKRALQLCDGDLHSVFTSLVEK